MFMSLWAYFCARIFPHWKTVCVLEEEDRAEQSLGNKKRARPHPFYEHYLLRWSNINLNVSHDLKHPFWQDSSGLEVNIEWRPTALLLSAKFFMALFCQLQVRAENEQLLFKQIKIKMLPFIDRSLNDENKSVSSEIYVNIIPFILVWLIVMCKVLTLTWMWPNPSVQLAIRTHDEGVWTSMWLSTSGVSTTFVFTHLHTNEEWSVAIYILLLKQTLFSCLIPHQWPS